MFEEVKEMIDSTIYTNGRGEVTAQNVNLAMHGILDAVEGKFEEVENKVAALEENGTDGGSGALKVWIPIEIHTELTPEQIAENVATYNEIVKGEPVSVILCQGGSVNGMTVIGTMPTTASCTDFEGNKTVMLLANHFVFGEIVTTVGQLYSDGSVAMTTETFEVPSPSGPLKVWINEENTPEQIAENISTYNAIKDKRHENVVLCFDERTDIWEASVTFPVSVDYEATNGDGIAFLDAVIAADPDNSSKTHVMLVRLYKDGATEISFQYDQTNGPLTVWINEENTPEQIAENAATFRALKDGPPTSVVFAIVDELEKALFSVSVYDVTELVFLSHYSQMIIDNSLTPTYINVVLNEDGSTEVEFI